MIRRLYINEDVNNDIESTEKLRDHMLESTKNYNKGKKLNESVDVDSIYNYLNKLLLLLTYPYQTY